MAACGDVDGDGLPDLAVASRDRSKPDLVWIVSGKDGSLLRTLRGKHERDGFGSRIVGVGDLDGDGTPDIAVRAEGGPVESYTRVLSGKTAEALIELDDCGDIAPVRDIDHDGRAELLYTALPVAWSSRSTPAVIVRFGQVGKKPIEIQPSTKPASECCAFGDSVCWTADIDGDGFQEIAVSSVALKERGGVAKSSALSVAVYSSRDARRLWETIDRVGGVCDNDGDADHSTVRLLDDLDGDGTADLTVGLAHHTGWKFSARLITLSGKNGAKLREVQAREDQTIECVSSTLDVVGDVNKDGVQDWVLGLNTGDRLAFQFGWVRVVSGKTGEALRELEYSRDFGFTASGVGDLNGDGIPDVAELVVRERDPGPDLASISALNVRSGKDGHMIWQRTLPEYRRASIEKTPK